MKKTLLLSFSLVFMLSFVLSTPVYASTDSDPFINLANDPDLLNVPLKIEIGQDESEEESAETEQKKEEPSQTPPPKEEKQKVTLTVNYHLTKNDLIVRGKLDKEVDDGVFKVTFQNITKTFEGPDSSFTATFPRSKLKSGKHTLSVSFKGLIGDQVVKDQKHVLVSIPKVENKKSVSLKVSYQLTKKNLYVYGKLDQKVDSGVFKVIFQGITKTFEGPGNSFTATFPRSKLKAGKHTLFVSFKGLIGDQVVKDQKHILVTIPKVEKQKSVSLKVSYQLTKNNLYVYGKLNKKVDSGIFTVTFQGITKSFEGPGSSFKAQFPRSKLKSGKYTLFVSFKGLIGDQVVKDQKQILITIPPKSKVTTPKGKDDSTKKSTKQTSNNKASTSKKPLKTAAKKTANQKIGGPLPKTATNLPTLALSGILLMGIGVAIWLRRRAY